MLNEDCLQTKATFGQTEKIRVKMLFERMKAKCKEKTSESSNIVVVNSDGLVPPLVKIYFEIQ